MIHTRKENVDKQCAQNRKVFAHIEADCCISLSQKMYVAIGFFVDRLRNTEERVKPSNQVFGRDWRGDPNGFTWPWLTEPIRTDLTIYTSLRAVNGSHFTSVFLSRSIGLHRRRGTPGPNPRQYWDRLSTLVSRRGRAALWLFVARSRVPLLVAVRFRGGSQVVAFPGHSPKFAFCSVSSGF